MTEAPGVWKSRVAVGLLLVLVFAAGMISEALVFRLRTRHARGEAPRARASFGPDRDRHFGEELGLDSLERVKIDSVFAHRRVQVDSFWKGPGRGLRDIMDSTRGEVRAVLTPEQRARFDRMHMERRPQHPGEDAGPPMVPPR